MKHRETGKSSQALAIAGAIKKMMVELEGLAKKSLLENVEEDEKDNLYVKVGQSSTNKMLIDFQIYNSATKAKVIKSYTIIDLLRECSDIFLVNSLIDRDMKNLYKKSKEKVFKRDTVLFI